MEKDEFIRIATKLAEGSASEYEMMIYNAYYNRYQAQYPEWEQVSEEIKLETKALLNNRINSRISIQKPTVRMVLWPHFVAAAVALLCLSIAAWFYFANPNQLPAAITYAGDVAPGGNKAILTLSSGQQISLTDAKNGALATQSGIEIVKTKDGQLVYKVSDGQNTSGATQYNTVQTPKGGQHQILLPDGTKVWLNAASSLKFPTTFANALQRKVELNGEAYFEVYKDKAHPFIVQSKLQEIEVLGTHFNVNSYADEPGVKTTLLEGSVKVSAIIAGTTSSSILKPGQQSMLTGSVMRISDADLEADLAWKNGDFIFNGESLESIMRKVARWYDIQVVYTAGAPRDFILGGFVSRSKPISAVLELMEKTGKVRFEVTGRRITVMP